MRQFTTFVLAVFILALAWPATGQSLGELAKKNAASKAKKDDGKTKPIAKTYTNKDLEAIDLPETKVEPTIPVKADPIPEPAPLTASNPPSTDEATWRSRTRELEARLAEDTLQLSAARIRLAEYVTAVERSRVSTNGGVYVSRVAQQQMFDARNDVSRLTALVKGDQFRLDQFLEDARRAGVPPGWLR